MDDKLKLIREVILNIAKKYNVEIDRIILFGSRARGDCREDSDWDILIVTKEELDKEVLESFWDDLNWGLAKYIVPEIIITDKKNFEKYKKLTGYVYYWAEKEGVLIT